MKVSKRGAVAAAAFFFVGGLAAAPDAKVIEHTEVRVVKVPKLVMIRDDQTKVEREPAPLPEVCVQALEMLEEVRSHDAVLDEVVQSMALTLADGQRILATGVPAEMVPIIEKMTASRQEVSNSSIAKAEALLRYDDRIKACRSQTSK